MTEIEDDLPDEISAESTGLPFAAFAENDADADWSGDDLEAAYRKALETLEFAEATIPPPPAPVEDIADSSAVAAPPDGVSAGAQQLAKDLAERASPPPAAAVAEPTVTPEQIIEACLFVGGQPLTAKRMLSVLRTDAEVALVERLIDSLNRRYAAENRPYEVRLVEGGYRLTLHEDYDRIRAKVYGQGPKEVRLSQDVLEILAVVAYHQPISQKEIEELGRPQCGPVLRQLLRRELIAVKRHPDRPKDVPYVTTPRFLSLFGIGSLDDLPRPEQLLYK